MKNRKQPSGKTLAAAIRQTDDVLCRCLSQVSTKIAAEARAARSMGDTEAARYFEREAVSLREALAIRVRRARGRRP